MLNNNKNKNFTCFNELLDNCVQFYMKNKNLFHEKNHSIHSGCFVYRLCSAHGDNLSALSK